MRYQASALSGMAEVEVVVDHYRSRLGSDYQKGDRVEMTQGEAADGVRDEQLKILRRIPHYN